MKEPYTYTNEYGDTKEIPLEDIDKFRKDKNFQKMMENFLHDEKEKYFLKLTQEAEKLPQHFNVETIVTQEEKTEISKLQIFFQAKKEKLAQMMREKDKPLVKQYTLDTICPFSFVRDLYMPPFPRGFKLPKYKKYLGISDPQYHLKEFDTFSMEFMHNKMYLMHLFPLSIGGQAMEWYS